MEKKICKRCWHTWFPRVEKVKECPKCKSRNWDTPKKNDSLGKLFDDLSKPKEEEILEIPKAKEEPSPLAVLIGNFLNNIGEKK